MKYRNIKGFEIDGHLDIIVIENEDEFDGNIEKWNEILIHGDSQGLKSFANQLIYLAELDQEKVEDKYLPNGAREHLHLRPNFELSKSSTETIIGRLDSKGKKEFPINYITKDKRK
ncbi:MAG: hypothetical protein K0B37_13375 [Bacteroidales bacterium]|nr:hypothetical protein [Bacteroidales bacterium]